MAVFPTEALTMAAPFRVTSAEDPTLTVCVAVDPAYHWMFAQEHVATAGVTSKVYDLVMELSLSSTTLSLYWD